MTILAGEYCCPNLKKAWNNDVCYYKAKEDSYNAITKDGWYMQ